MIALRGRELRSLAILLELADGTRAPADVLRRQAQALPRRMRRAALDVAAAWERGAAQPLGAGVPQGRDLRASLRLLTARAEAADLARGILSRRALLPILTAALALATSAIALATCAPVVDALLDETSALLGGAPPSATLTWIAGRAAWILSGGLIAAALLALSPLLAPPIARTRIGAAAIARLPLAARLQSALAARDFAAAFATDLEGGLPPHEAAARAAGEACCPWARPRLERMAMRLRAGEPAAIAFDDDALAPLSCLRAAALDATEGRDIARQAEERAAEQVRVSTSRLAAVAVASAHALTAAAVLLLAWQVLLPLATLGAAPP